MGNVFGKNPYHKLNANQKEKLKNFIAEILSKDSIDYTNQEVQDISTAVYTMLRMGAQRMNNRGVFNVSKIQPGGSMAEKTSLWKLSKKIGEPAMEFDFLAVLNERLEQVANLSCLLCGPVKKPPVNMEFLRKYYNNSVESLEDGINAALKFNNLFIQELCTCMVSSCGCFSVKHELDDVDETYFRRISFSQEGPICAQCSVDMPTGSLRVNTTIDIDSSRGSPANCSIIFTWISKIHSLPTPVDLTLQKCRPVVNLPVFVDFLPALHLNPVSESIEKHTFLVSKRCHKCIHKSWRKSVCLLEMHYIQNIMSDKHLKCFKLFKYLMKVSAYQGADLMYFDQYAAKNVAINHDIECTDLSKDIAECTIKMLYDLEQAFKIGRLLCVTTGAYILTSSVYGHRFEYIRQLVDRFCSVSETDSWQTYAQKLTAKLDW